MPNPALVQYAKFGGAQDSTVLRNWPLPNAVLAGNALIGFGTCQNGQTPTPTDDKSGVYTVIQNTNDVGNGQRAFCFYRLNIVDAPTVVKLGFSPANGYVSGYVAEWRNIPTVAATDGSNGSVGAGTTRAPGSITTTADGDVIFSYIVEDAVDPFVTNQAIAAWTAPAGMTLLAADRWVGEAVAYQIQATAGAINPSWTLSPSRNCICLQVAFKNAAQGTAPIATPRIVGTFHQGLDYGGNHASPFVLQLPFQGIGTMLRAEYVGLRNPGAITDSNGNTWTATGAAVVNTSVGNSGYVRAYSSFTPTVTNTMTVSIAYTGTGAVPGDTCMFHEVVGLASLAAHQSGTLTGAGTSFQVGAVTPLAAGVVFTFGGQDANTTIAVNTGRFVPSTSTGEASPCANDENNFWSFYANPDTTAVQPTYTTDAAAADVAWFSDAYSAGGGGGGGGGGGRGGLVALMGVG